MYDIAIIGAGVVGGMLARKLAKYDLRICILEKANDVATGASAANSGIVHAGFDALPGSLKARLNVRGSEMMEQTACELGVKYRRNGSLVLAFDEEEIKTLKALLDRGKQNGVKNMKILGKRELSAQEPNISENAAGALFAPTGAIISPYELAIAAVGNAMDNGADLKLDFEVTDIRRENGFFRVFSGKNYADAKYVVNAAGIFSDKIAAYVGDRSFSVHARRGEYILLDRECGNLVSSTVFTVPTEKGKGILLSQTADGNLLAGPTAEDIDVRDDKRTTQKGLARVMQECLKISEKVPFSKAITSFCGLRAVGSTGDFIINSPVSGFINLAGIESPGLSASPAIAEYAVKMLSDMGLKLREKENYIKTRPPVSFFRDATDEQKNEIIRRDSTFGHIVCRCEGITEGEILNALRTNPPACDLDGVKRRTRAQAGRCQGGFCMPLVAEIISRELNISYSEVTKCGNGSKIAIGSTKEAENGACDNRRRSCRIKRRS